MSLTRHSGRHFIVSEVIDCPLKGHLSLRLAIDPCLIEPEGLGRVMLKYPMTVMRAVYDESTVRPGFGRANIEDCELPIQSDEAMRDMVPTPAGPARREVRMSRNPRSAPGLHG